MTRLATDLLALMDLPPLDKLHYVQERVQMPNPNAYTAQELKWQREALELEAAVEAARGMR